MINSEKEALMKSFKRKLNNFHTCNVISLVLVAALTVFFLSTGGFNSIGSSLFLGYLLLMIIAWTISIVMLKHSSKLKSIFVAREYLQQYDKNQRTLFYLSVISLIIVFSLAAFLCWNSTRAIVIIVGWAIILLAYFCTGKYKNSDIERLCELLEML